MSLDERVVYGASCTWWDSIQKVDVLDNGIPCCPHCRGVLFEVPTQSEWEASVTEHAERTKDPDYEPFITWLRGRCFPSHEAAVTAYRKGKACG